MNVLLNLRTEDSGVEPRHIEQIKAVSSDVELLDLPSEGEILEAMPDVDVVFGTFTPAMNERGRRLRWVQVTSAGVDGVLFPEFVDSDVVLTSAKGIVGVHLADHAMALLLTLTRGIHTAIRSPRWDQRMPIRNASWELEGKTMGIVGLGGTGRDLAVRAHAFGMRIIAVDPVSVEIPLQVEACGRMDGLDDLLEQSDVVAICAPLTPETENMFDERAFSLMRDHALLINVTRGRIMKEDALVAALTSGAIGGAGLDVTPQEPLPDDHPLWSMSNVVVTPHASGGSPVRGDRIVDLFCENLWRFIYGEPLLSVIDKNKGY